MVSQRIALNVINELPQPGASSEYSPQPSRKKEVETFQLSTPDAEVGSGTAFVLHENIPRESEILTRELSEQDSLIVDEDIEFPEGGLKAYLVVFGSFMGLVPVFGLPNSAGAIEAYVSSHQLAEVSSSTVSWIFSINAFIGFAGGLFAGAYFDRNGTRLLMTLGTMFFFAGLFATGNCTTVYQFVLSFGVVCGVGIAMTMSPLIGVLSHYFRKNRATACSVATTGGSIGGIVFPLLLRKLYPTVGFTWAMRIMALICLCCLLCSLVFVKERFTNKDEEGNGSFKETLKSYTREVFDPQSLKDVKFVFCALAISFSEASLFVIMINFPSYVIKRGFGEDTSYLLVTVINATGILGRYIPGYVADRFLGRFNVMMLTSFGCVLVCCLLWLPFGYSLKVLFSFAALYGFFSGSILSLAPVCCGQISKTGEFGKRYGTTYLVASIAMLTVLPLGGAVISRGNIHNYNNFIIYVSMLTVGAVLFYGVSRFSVVGLKLCKF